MRVQADREEDVVGVGGESVALRDELCDVLRRENLLSTRTASSQMKNPFGGYRSTRISVSHTVHVLKERRRRCEHPHLRPHLPRYRGTSLIRNCPPP